VWALNFAGVVLALYVFMADTLAAVPRGLEAVCSVLPEKFNWPLFLVALALMAVPVAKLTWQLLTGASGGAPPTRACLDASSV
jgi:hypothetical protein